MPRLDAAALEELRGELARPSEHRKTCITVCGGTGCHAYGCVKVAEAFKQEIPKHGLQESVDIRVTGCHGFCERGPIVVIQPDGIFYQRLKLSDIPEVISETIAQKKVISRLLYVEPRTNEKILLEEDVPFYKGQQRILLKNNGRLDPTDIRDYIALGGYGALRKVLFELSPEQVIDEIKASGLRGRGGGGFLTGVKWEICRNAPSDARYLICNADEGDPGAYMDRSLLEGNPHSAIEGMIIGGYAIGASRGHVYVRMEYPLAVKNVGLAIRQARELGLLGGAILGSTFSFDIDVFRGAGAFVSGEETSLMASIEGRRAFPRQRPPYPSESGLWGKPTNINNVETWANVPLIIGAGSAWYASIGTEKSKGTKIFSLVGKINNTGLVEVPMGITLREIIHEIGGGIKDNKEFKALQTGGPSGGCLPASMLDLPIDFDTLARAGSIMGSGGMIVMDEDTCMVDVARYFLQFTKEESCGKCVPCRVGTQQMVDILTRITEGNGRDDDIPRLEALCRILKDGSLCGLGQTAPNPVLTTLKYFREEYEDHIQHNSCTARVCKSLLRYYIEPEVCVGCLVCLKYCPGGAISGERKKPHVIDQQVCTSCGACFDVCPPKVSAVVKLTGAERERVLPAATAEGVRQ